MTYPQGHQQYPPQQPYGQPHPGHYPPQYQQMPVPYPQQGFQPQTRPNYVRQQKGHSIIKHLLLGWVVGYLVTIYYAVSPNHYFHA